MTRRSWVGVGSVLALLALLVGYGVYVSRGERAARTEAAPASATAAESELASRKLSSVSEAGEPLDARSTTAIAEQRSSAADALAESGTRTRAAYVLNGTVRLSDARGQLLPPHDGTLSLWLRGVADANSRDSLAPTFHRRNVTAGAWSLEIADPQARNRILSVELVVDDRDAVIDSQIHDLPLPLDRFLEIRAHLPPAASSTRRQGAICPAFAS